MSEQKELQERVKVEAIRVYRAYQEAGIPIKKGYPDGTEFPVVVRVKAKGEASPQFLLAMVTGGNDRPVLHLAGLGMGTEREAKGQARAIRCGRREDPFADLLIK